MLEYGGGCICYLLCCLLCIGDLGGGMSAWWNVLVLDATFIICLLC